MLLAESALLQKTRLKRIALKDTSTQKQTRMFGSRSVFVARVIMYILVKIGKSDGSFMVEMAP
jgi:hypothetical protein